MSEDVRDPELGLSEGDADAENVLQDMWAQSMQEILAIRPESENWKLQALPLARIKKIMKSEEIVTQELERERLLREGQPAEEKGVATKFMISAEAPILMSKACELLIKEISSRAWMHTERNRRRTLQRQDVHAAVGESEVYDFLIDIVPRVTAAAGRGAIPQVAAQEPSMVNMAVAQVSVPGNGSDFAQLPETLQAGQFASLFYQQVAAPSLDDTGQSLGIGMIQQVHPAHQQQQQQQTHQWNDPSE